MSRDASEPVPRVLNKLSITNLGVVQLLHGLIAQMHGKQCRFHPFAYWNLRNIHS